MSKEQKSESEEKCNLTPAEFENALQCLVESSGMDKQLDCPSWLLSHYAVKSMELFADARLTIKNHKEHE